MLACDKTITVVHYADERYTCTLVDGVSWFEKLQVAVQEKGLSTANTFTVRIPADAIPENFMPQAGDVVIQGTVAGEITRPADIGAYHHFTVRGVGDNRRKVSRLKHVVVTGV